jgi:hypothetical protein
MKENENSYGGSILKYDDFGLLWEGLNLKPINTRLCLLIYSFVGCEQGYL